MLLWAKNTPTGDEMEEMLKSEDFRERICAFIKANIRAFAPGLETAASVKAVPVEKDIAYNRPPNPNLPNYEERLRAFELRLARTEQVHTCRVKRCLIPDNKGVLVCKRKAPFQCAPEDFITESGDWGPKRLYGFTNGWCPGVLINARCNNDIKLLTNGDATKCITFYVTSYAAKKQNRDNNLSALIARTYSYHLDHPNADYVDAVQEQSRQLLFRMGNALNYEQILAGPMIASYLTRRGDVLRSHKYSTIYWSSFKGHLLRIFPSLIKNDARYVGLHLAHNVVTELTQTGRRVMCKN
jgi:hypothetical protein